MSFWCKIGLHAWIRQYAYDIHDQGDMGEVKQCIRCGKRTQWGVARFPDHWNRMRNELIEAKE